MKKTFNFITVRAFLLLLITIIVTSCTRVNIDSTEEVNKFIKGKWHYESVGRSGLVTYYRFEVTDAEIKCWKSSKVVLDNGHVMDNYDWIEEHPMALSIGSIQTDSYGNKYRNVCEASYGTLSFQSGLDGKDWLVFKLVGVDEDYPERDWKY